MKIDPALIQSLASASIPWGKNPDRASLQRQKKAIRERLAGFGIGPASANGIIESAISRQACSNRSGHILFLQDCHLRDTLRASGLLSDPLPAINS